MNSDQDMVIGFYNLLQDDQTVSILQSTIFGQPLWLDPFCTQIQSLKCQYCQSVPKLLLQLYSPLENQSSWYRKIFVFACIQKQCQQHRNAVQVIRQQLGKHNEIIDDEGIKQQFQKEYWDQLEKVNRQFVLQDKVYEIDCDLIGCQEQVQQYQKVMAKMADNNINIADKSDILASFQDQLLQLNDNQIYQNVQNYQHENELLKQFQDKVTVETHEEQNQQLEIETVENDDNEADLEEIDKMLQNKDEFFEFYQQVLKENHPREVIRFCRDQQSVPLYINKKDQFNTVTQDQKCKQCNNDLVFEFQIHSTLFNLSRKLYEVDWGIICVFSCSNSCGSTVQEWVEVQMGGELELQVQEDQKDKEDEVDELEQMVTKKMKKKKQKQKQKQDVDGLQQKEEEEQCDWS